MKLEVYAVHDSAVGAYNKPLYFRSRGEAVRSFQDACRDPQNGFSTHAEHFSFWYIADYFDESGLLQPIDHVRVCGANDFVIAE